MYYGYPFGLVLTLKLTTVSLSYLSSRGKFDCIIFLVENPFRLVVIWGFVTSRGKFSDVKLLRYTKHRPLVELHHLCLMCWNMSSAFHVEMSHPLMKRNVIILGVLSRRLSNWFGGSSLGKRVKQSVNRSSCREIKLYISNSSGVKSVQKWCKWLDSPSRCSTLSWLRGNLLLNWMVLKKLWTRTLWAHFLHQTSSQKNQS